jgi:hypothetical protein
MLHPDNPEKSGIGLESPRNKNMRLNSSSICKNLIYGYLFNKRIIFRFLYFYSVGTREWNCKA